MNQKFNGSTIEAKPPIASISVNKFSVVFKDNNELKRVRLNSASETKEFVSWLLTI
jgi:hypothetical protein